MIALDDGSSVVGKIVGAKDKLLLVATNPYDFTQTIKMDAGMVQSIQPSPVSPMPPGLSHRLNENGFKALLRPLPGA